jgi:hypothetical protein
MIAAVRVGAVVYGARRWMPVLTYFEIACAELCGLAQCRF